jgi:hypothetical protein
MDFTAHLYGRSLGIHLQRKQIDLTRRRLLNHVQAPIPVDGEELLHRLAIGLCRASGARRLCRGRKCPPRHGCLRACARFAHSSRQHLGRFEIQTGALTRLLGLVPLNRRSSAAQRATDQQARAQTGRDQPWIQQVGRIEGEQPALH